jgi:Skp family chaperone for outer membrane proteins
VPKVKVIAFVNLARMQALLQNFMRKLARRHQRKIAREGKQQNRIHSSGLQQPQLFRKRSQQFQILIGTQMRAGCGSNVTTTECP